MPGDQVRNYKIRYSVEDKAGPAIKALGTTLDAGGVKSDAFRAKLKPTEKALWDLSVAADNAELSLKNMNAELGKTGQGGAAKLQPISGALGRIDFNADRARQSVEQLNAKLAGTGATAGGVTATQAAVQSLQRTSYGAFKNVESLNAKLGQIGAHAGGIGATTAATAGLGTGLKTTDQQAAKVGRSFGGVAAAMIAVQAAGKVVEEIAEGTRKARTESEKWAESTIKLRDSLRELANLQGKPGADDKVVGDQLGFRMQTGMSAGEAQKFQEQFLGSLPLAKDAGGITDDVGKQLAGQVGRTATRTGLEASTAGDLAGVMGMFGAVPDAKVGLGRTQQIVDLLNDGRGNLTPLTKGLLKGAASTVGEGKAFGSLQERAAAISVASGIGDKNATDTTLGAAIRGLSPGGKVDHIKTLEELGIGGNQSFEERLDRLKPLFDQAKQQGKSPNDVLLEKGFGNIQDRRSLIGFYENRETLRKRTASVREDDPNDPNAKARAAGDRSERLNSEFYAGDKAARDRVASAKVDWSTFRRGKQEENLLIERKEAEAELRNRGEIDTPLSNFKDSLTGGFGLSEKLGGKSGRELRIDSEIKRKAIQARETELGRPLKADERFELSDNDASFSANYLGAKKKRDADPKTRPGRQDLPGQQAFPAVVPPKLDDVGDGDDPGIAGPTVAVPRGIGSSLQKVAGARMGGPLDVATAELQADRNNGPGPVNAFGPGGDGGGSALDSKGSDKLEKISQTLSSMLQKMTGPGSLNGGNRPVYPLRD